MSEKPWQLPENITPEFLDALSEHVDADQYAMIYLNDRINGTRNNKLYDAIKESLPSTEEIFDQMTQNGYFESTITISEGRTASFRTLTQTQEAEVRHFVDTAIKPTSEKDRLQAMISRRTSYGVVSLGNITFYNPFPNPGLSQDYSIQQYAEMIEKAYAKQQSLPSVLADQISRAYSTWEAAVQDRVSVESVFDVLGNSKRGRSQENAPT